MAYHICRNGDVALCEATDRPCPLSPLDEHFETPEEAMMFFEAEQKGSQAERLHQAQLDMIEKSAQVFKQTSLKELDSTQLTQALIYEANEVGIDKTALRGSISLATILHSHQKRGNRGGHKTTPYIEHPLRNSLRLIRLGVKDQDVVIASVLHDTIEDGASKFCEKFLQKKNIDELEARKTLSSHIKKTYGKRVVKLVESVTNDYLTDTDKSKMSISRKNKSYYDHVEKNVTNEPQVLLVKRSDVIENATGRDHNDVPGREAKTLKQAVKYLPVVPVFEKEIQRQNIHLSKRSKAEILIKLENTKKRLQIIIDKYSNR